MQLAVGQKFGIGRGYLFCVVEGESQEGELQCRAINGSWYFDLLPDRTMRIHERVGTRMQSAPHIYTDRRLQRFGDYAYNEACLYLKTAHRRLRLVVWAEDKLLDARASAKRFGYACKMAGQAFMTIWRPRKAGQPMSEYELWHDDVAF